VSMRMRLRHPMNVRRMAGLSLVELMIAMTLGLATVGAVGYVYLGTSQTYRAQDALARLQEGARYAFEVIGNDLRMTGATGCSWRTAVNVVNNFEDNWYTNMPAQPLLGLEEDGAAGVTEFSDALAVLHADISREYIVQAHNIATAQITTDAAHGLAGGAFLIATNCDNVAVFRASAAGGATIDHDVGGSDGNAIAELGEGGAALTYAPGSRIYRLSASTYYIANNPAGQPSLYRTRLDGAGVPTAEELVEGVEDVQFSYGVDITDPADNAADFVDPDGDGDPYLTAAQIDAAVPGATPEERWARVLSVRVSLLMRTVENNIAPTAQAYEYNGAAVNAADRRVRKVFTHVIKVRNR
jgi:type IV pilus assembly protein PilW